jgi:hypothetical protein
MKKEALDAVFSVLQTSMNISRQMNALPAWKRWIISALVGKFVVHDCKSLEKHLKQWEALS